MKRGFIADDPRMLFPCAWLHGDCAADEFGDVGCVCPDCEIVAAAGDGCLAGFDVDEWHFGRHSCRSPGLAEVVHEIAIVEERPFEIWVVAQLLYNVSLKSKHWHEGLVSAGVSISAVYIYDLD